MQLPFILSFFICARVVVYADSVRIQKSSDPPDATQLEFPETLPPSDHPLAALQTDLFFYIPFHMCEEVTRGQAVLWRAIYDPPVVLLPNDVGASHVTRGKVGACFLPDEFKGSCGRYGRSASSVPAVELTQYMISAIDCAAKEDSVGFYVPNNGFNKFSNTCLQPSTLKDLAVESDTGLCISADGEAIDASPLQNILVGY